MSEMDGRQEALEAMGQTLREALAVAPVHVTGSTLAGWIVEVQAQLAQAQAERDALVERVRGVVAELHPLALNGSKTGRPDYVRMVTQEQLWRWYQALAALPPQQKGDATP